MIPNLDEGEIRRYEGEIDQLERSWALCECACPGLDSCPVRGVRLVAVRAGPVIDFRASFCPLRLVAEQKARLDRLLQASRMTVRFLERRFATFEQRPGTEKAYRACRQYAMSYPEAQPVVLVGPVGSGKTHLLAAVANELLDRAIPVIFAVVPDLLADLRSAMRRGDDPEAVMDELRDVAVLCLDDLGAEKVSDWTRETLYRLVNYRYEQNLPILATTNLPTEELEDCIGERTVSRLMEMCRWALVDAGDYRKRKLGDCRGEK